MHCYVFGMYLKDGPLRSSDYIYVFGMYLKDGPLRSSDYIFAKCML